MPEQHKPAEQAAKPAPAPALARAAESGDAAVHNLLGQREIHVRNGNTAGVAAVDEALAGLGFAV